MKITLKEPAVYPHTPARLLGIANFRRIDQGTCSYLEQLTYEGKRIGHTLGREAELRYV